jgi:hypothetical protein
MDTQPQSGADKLTPNYLSMEVCTAYHRITGEALTIAFRTGGVLNSSLPYVMLHNVSTGSLIRPQDPPIVSSHCRVTKTSIVLAIPNEAAENDRLARRPPTLLQRELLQHRVLIGLGDFEISGNLHMDKELSLETALLDRPETFVPLTSANIIYLPNLNLKFSASTVIINKNFVGFISAGTPQ